MPQKLRNILWASGLSLTILGLILAVVMNNLGHDNVLFLLPPSIGVAIIGCLLVSSLIHEIVSDIVQQMKEMRGYKAPPVPDADEAQNKTAADKSTAVK